MDNRLFEEIYNENFLQKVGQAALNAGNKAQAKSNVKNAANLKAAQANTTGAEKALKTLQAIANEQQQFDANTIKSLIDDINKLQIDDKIKKNINHILNNQNAALQKQGQNQEAQPQQQQSQDQQNGEEAAPQANDSNNHTVNVNGKTMSAIDAVTKDNNDFKKAIPFFKQIGVTADEVKQGVDALWGQS